MKEEEELRWRGMTIGQTNKRDMKAIRKKGGKKMMTL
jgi:hypothetical protein